MTGLVLVGGMPMGFPSPALLAAQTLARVPSVNRGGGEDEHTALRVVEREYHLKLTYALPDGHYLGGAAIVITAALGQVILGIVSPGPWFLARLPIGMYTIQVAVGSITPQQVAHVREDRAVRAHFTWSGGLPEWGSCGREEKASRGSLMSRLETASCSWT